MQSMVLHILFWQWIPTPIFICLRGADAAVLAGVTEVYEKGNTRWARFQVLEAIKGQMAHGDTFSLQFASQNTEGIWTSVFYPEAIFFNEPGGDETNLLLLSATYEGYTLYPYYPYAVISPPADDPGFVYRIRALAEFDTLGPDTSLIRDCLESESRIFQESGLYLARYLRDKSLARDIRAFLESPDGNLRSLARETLAKWGLKWGN